MKMKTLLLVTVLSAGFSLGAWAQKSAADGIAEYRAMLADGNPSELFEAKGEDLWKQKRGPKKESLERCDLGKGPGVVKGAFVELPRFFADTKKVQDLESRLVSCMETLQGFNAAEIAKTPYGRGEQNNVTALATWISGESKGMKFNLSQSHVEERKMYEVGKRLFLTYCYQCHGSDARGAKGFPNLTDNDWLYGGSPEVILQTITNGRNGMMPPHAHLGADAIKDLANYVRSLSGLANDSLRAAKGKELFASSGCAGCHGPDGKGNQAIGAPNLTDNVWLYGSSEKTITETITNGRQNMMPAFGERLNEGKLKLLSAYVYSLSQKPEAK